MRHDPFQVPDLNDVHRRILDAVGFKVPASANLDDARDALEDHYLAMKRGPERDRFETAFTLMIYGDVVDGKPYSQTQSKIRALEQSGKTAHSRRQEMKKKSSEHGAGSDGNYMTKQNLWLLHRMTELLYKGIPDGVLLPDWAESKINSAADHIKAVAGWAMHESHGDDLHPAPEANPIHLAGEGELRSKLMRLAHSNPDLRPHLLPLLKVAAEEVNVPGKHILDNAEVYGKAKVFGGATVYGGAVVYGDAKVYGNAKVYGKAKVYGNADISGGAQILGGNWDGSEGPITEGKWMSPGIPVPLLRR